MHKRLEKPIFAEQLIFDELEVLGLQFIDVIFLLQLLRGIVHEALAHIMLVKAFDLALVDLEHDEVIKYGFAFLVGQHLDCTLVVGEQLSGAGL